MSRTDNIRQRLVGKREQVLKVMAGRLNRYVNQKTRSQQTCALILCCLIFAAWSISLIIGGIRGTPQRFYLQRITIPPTLNDRNKRSGMHNIDSLNIRKIHRALDSLHSLDPKRYDSLLFLYPLLLDSLRTLDSIYKHQNIQP